MGNLIKIENDLLLLPQVKIGDVFYDIRIEKFGADQKILPFEEGDFLETDVNKIRELAAQCFANANVPIEYKPTDETAPESVQHIYEIICPRHDATIVCLNGQTPAFIRVERVMYSPPPSLPSIPREAALLPPPISVLEQKQEEPKFDVSRLAYSDLEKFASGKKSNEYLRQAHELFKQLMQNPEDANNPLGPWLLEYYRELRNQGERDPAFFTRFVGACGIDPKPLENYLVSVA